MRVRRRAAAIFALCVCFALFAGCGGRKTRTKTLADPVVDAVLEFLSLRLDDYGDSYLLSDDLTGQRLHLSIAELPSHKDVISPGEWVVGVLFGSGTGNAGQHEVDFRLETVEGAVTVVEYRVHKEPVQEEGRWRLQERPMPAP